jgi:hypothetical protein
LFSLSSWSSHDRTFELNEPIISRAAGLLNCETRGVRFERDLAFAERNGRRTSSLLRPYNSATSLGLDGPATGRWPAQRRCAYWSQAAR